jgi:hypothetical protein
MRDEKDFFASKTTWGALVPILVMLARQFGFDLGDEQGWIDGAAMLTGGALLLWGQISRVKRIGSVAGVKLP